MLGEFFPSFSLSFLEKWSFWWASPLFSSIIFYLIFAFAFFIYAGNWLVDVVLRIPFLGEELGKGWEYNKGMLFGCKDVSVIACQVLQVSASIYFTTLPNGVFREYLQLGIKRLQDYPQPFWLALFVEGTRFTQAKLLAAQEYATSQGLPVPRNVLIPRTKVILLNFSLNACIISWSF